VEKPEEAHQTSDADASADCDETQTPKDTSEGAS
jgi:hypothetical protein